jgi:hypothetical protein
VSTGKSTAEEVFVTTLREKLIEAHSDGTFLQAIFEGGMRLDDNQQAIIAAELVALHNEGLIDVIDAFKSLNNDNSGPDFFLTEHILQKALPDIKSPVVPVIECILHLYRQAGRDLGAGVILSSFVQFCAKDATRPPQALNEIENRPDILADILIPTFHALALTDYPQLIERIIPFMSSNSEAFRSRAIFALSGIQWPAGRPIPDSIFATLAQILQTDQSDEVLANIVRSASILYEKDKSKEQEALSLMEIALNRGGEQTLHTASTVFAFNTLSPAIFDILRPHLKRIPSKNTQSLGCVGLGISRLIGQDKHAVAIELAEELLLNHPDITLEQLGGLGSVIRSNNALMTKIMTRWLRLGELNLCKAAHEIPGMGQMEGQKLEIDPNEVDSNNAGEVLFLAHKIIGYFFLQPISAASLIISLMRNVSADDVLAELSDLLFDPLLVNYLGKLREYVRQQAEVESRRVQSAINAALKPADDYLTTLNSIGKLPALYVSEAQREAYKRYMSASMAETQKQVEKKSVLLSMFSRSTLLYGTKSIYRVYGTDGQSKRMEMPLHPYGVQFEMPRMQVIDPFGLDYMLRVFRSEKRAA